MNLSDKKLGMHCSITRRDVLHGIGQLTTATLATGAMITPISVLASTSEMPGNYPPALSGLRGNHPGSFDVAHKLAREGVNAWGTAINPDNGIYDLVVVGAGISGLSSAHFYQKQFPDAKILLLDNHDDFGGHAKRNEFKTEDGMLIGYGGAQTLEEPSSYSDIVKGLLKDLGIKIERFDKAYDQSFFKQHKLRAGIHFNRKSWGVDKVVPYDLGILGSYLPLKPSAVSAQTAVAEMPISDAAKKEFLRLLLIEDDQIPDVPKNEKKQFLRKISYRNFLEKYLDIHEPEVFAVLQDLASDFGIGIEAAPALSALNYGGLPGWDAAGLDDVYGSEEEEAYIHHFPDGNASIARMLVRELIPAVAPGSSMEDVVSADFDYSKLDVAGSVVRLRLNSTVTRVMHDSNPVSSKKVSVSYVQNEQAYQIQARKCILACNNSIIPYLCPELPKTQRDALALQVKTPILYTNVALRNWKAWKNLGIGAVVSPGDYHINAMLDFPVSLGGYRYSDGPDKPIVVHMERFPHRNNEGLTPHEQKRLGRHELLTTSFETIERNVRNQLVSLLGAGGFDPAKDIIGITVNRWAHGYASSYNSLFDTVYDDWDDERYPHVQARKPFGRIAIANADSNAYAMFEAAVGQAHRAVSEIIP
ncbi:MAG: NAD(P)-binding protein [Gammaproteobacteria bacterium]|nr:NAD(P)-binding protein [Gammaproteobacteria bacterium]